MHGPLRRRFLSRALAVWLSLGLAGAPLPALAQVDNLPRLGDAGAEELSPSAERRLGDAIMREVRRDPAYSDDPEVTEYLNRLVAGLGQATSAAGFSFELFLVRDPTLNAFAFPGGFIGVHSGLITAAQSESELASVLAHEMGHVTQRHIARMLSQQGRTSMLSMAAMVLAVLAARSSPGGAMGIMTMAGGAQQQNMLSFSRDAEREADRVGIETLRQTGYDPNGMVSFFGRLQQSTRLYEGAAPAYMRSHPLTGERIADMQVRVREDRYRQRSDTLEFRLVRARLRALSGGSVDAQRTLRAAFEAQIRDRTTVDDLAAWFGLAVLTLEQRDFPAFERALAETRARVTAGHPYVERLAADARLRQGDAAGALAIARAAAARWVSSRALVHLQAQALLALGEAARAQEFLSDQLLLYRSDATLWRLLSQAWQALRQPAQAHRAAAEDYALTGSWLAAIEQLRLALRAGGLDFYTASLVDARLKDLQAEFTRDQQDRKGGR